MIVKSCKFLADDGVDQIGQKPNKLAGWAALEEFIKCRRRMKLPDLCRQHLTPDCNFEAVYQNAKRWNQKIVDGKATIEQVRQDALKVHANRDLTFSEESSAPLGAPVVPDV